MEKLSSLNLDFDRVLIQLIIPGLFAIMPWFIIFLNHSPFEADFLFGNPPLLVTLIALLSLVAGLLLENFGSRIEVMFFDKKNIKNDSNYLDTWFKFLTLNYDGKEPVGHRYIRNILLRMKFELSFGIAVLISAVGCILLDSQKLIIESCCLKVFLLYILPVCLFYYLIVIEAYSSSKVLASSRKSLVEKYYA
jgi:hypothetical protein